MKDKNEAAQSLARLSVEKRGLNKMTPEERSEYMKRVRAKQKLPIDNRL